MPAKFNGAGYNNFLTNKLSELIEIVPLNIRQQMIFQHDRAPPHNARRIRQTLNEKFPERWIGRNGPRSWPARSPDLIPLDYFLWGHIKEYVYREQIQNCEELDNRITEAIATVTPDMIRNAIISLFQCARLCI
ncbi:PREDICTED: uncharacterized protein LOC105453157 [Wasmannia auropunctata]|uniref:uncharacterized protein LOC105453157 n=1 Tax=Wasmannia auropunctata TaxID=64793 RepID=UPI0005F028EC|nr:PREDICTED: uncharacterized protein LOC105453157 [Wasmannia auropunctata]